MLFLKWVYVKKVLFWNLSELNSNTQIQIHLECKRKTKTLILDLFVQSLFIRLNQKSESDPKALKFGITHLKKYEKKIKKLIKRERASGN